MRNAYPKAAAALALAAAAFVAPAHAIEKAPAAAIAASRTGSAWPAVSVIGVASALVTYDLIRRLTCTGDFLRLGGPGFGDPIGPNTSVIPPRACPPRP